MGRRDDPRRHKPGRIAARRDVGIDGPRPSHPVDGAGASPPASLSRREQDGRGLRADYLASACG